MLPVTQIGYDYITRDANSRDDFAEFGQTVFGIYVEEAHKMCIRDRARRYYFNIVGKYGAQAAALLKKAAGLDIQKICPLHGPILQENLAYYIGKYQVWSS